MHYKDGTQAQIGDIARGPGYNHPYPVQGIVVGLVPGSDSCNLTVAIPKGQYPIDPANAHPRNPTMVDRASMLGKLEDGTFLPVGCEGEYGTVGDFELVHRPVKQPNGGYK